MICLGDLETAVATLRLSYYHALERIDCTDESTLLFHPGDPDFGGFDSVYTSTEGYQDWVFPLRHYNPRMPVETWVWMAGLSLLDYTVGDSHRRLVSSDLASVVLGSHWDNILVVLCPSDHLVPNKAKAANFDNLHVIPQGRTMLNRHLTEPLRITQTRISPQPGPLELKNLEIIHPVPPAPGMSLDLA
ncbi:hypothetical protein AYO20_10359 [Fonsecaea nubica]|uniref:Uncharacterized protein n=1 Tax=Fonsecaea nubica TaxID=856822 RepID=A0A178C8S6_9EURO|nr:hypothetical protein AYO20_10359 [Fonsecaea nubica]OAL25804.1 hypothetical protein AYO20_10359 [Fonsecaea nubica]